MSGYQIIDQGDIWYVDFEPPRGHEIGKVRPALVLSSSHYNTGAGTIYIIPVSSAQPKNLDIMPLHIDVAPDRINGLKSISYLNVTQIRAASRLRFERKIGVIDQSVVSRVALKLLDLWGLELEELLGIRG